jgi:hypothetical protein
MGESLEVENVGESRSCGDVLKLDSSPNKHQRSNGGQRHWKIQHTNSVQVAALQVYR